MSMLSCPVNYWEILIINLRLVRFVSVHVLGEWHFIFKCGNTDERSWDSAVGIATGYGLEFESQ
jgi:hypothetical protein